MMEELNPCPFCGGEVEISLSGTRKMSCWIITRGLHENRCKCRVFMESEPFERSDKVKSEECKKQLIVAWNRRHVGLHNLDASEIPLLTVINNVPPTFSKPLTLDELRKICKERAPVWIAEKGNPNYGGYWQYAYDSSSGTMAFFTFGNEVEEFYDTKNYGKTWLAYARKPEGEQD